MIDFLLMKRIWRRQYILWESIWVCRCTKHFISICFTFLTVLVFVLKPSVFKIALCVVFNSRPSDEEEVKRWARYRNTKTTQTCLIRGMFTILAEATAANGTNRWKTNVIEPKENDFHWEKMTTKPTVNLFCTIFTFGCTWSIGEPAAFASKSFFKPDMN